MSEGSGCVTADWPRGQCSDCDAGCRHSKARGKQRRGQCGVLVDD